ncbi:MAG: hypothetical protein ACE5WD_11300 [Candidatus Aminicenantia bacterium]
MSQKRKSQPIQPDFQIKFVFKFSIAILVVFLITSLLLYLIINEKLNASYFYSIYFLTHLNRNLIKYLLYSFSFQLAIITLATIIITLFTSHKIAGPLFRLERISEQIARGELPEKVRIRAKDQTKSVAQSMDNLVQEFKKKVEIITSYIEKIGEKRQKINKILTEREADLFRKEFNTIKKEINDIEKTLKSFRIK